MSFSPQTKFNPTISIMYKLTLITFIFLYSFLAQSQKNNNIFPFKPSIFNVIKQNDLGKSNKKNGDEEMKHRLDSIIAEQYTDIVPSDYYKEVYTYNESGAFLEVKGYSTDTGNNWLANFKTEYNYNAEGLVEEEIHYEWTDSTQTWNYVSKTEFSYNANGGLISETTYFYDNSWIPDYKREYTFDVNTYLIEEIHSNWSSIQNNWEYAEKTEYDNDNDGKPLEVIKHFWNSGSWGKYYKIESVYDNNENLITYTEYVAGGMSNWLNHQQTIYTYNSDNKLLTASSSYWDTGIETWMLTFLEERSYDGFGIPASYVCTNINGGFITYIEKTELSYDTEYSYDQLLLPNRHLEEAIDLFDFKLLNYNTFEWNSADSTWDETGKGDLYYSEQDILSVNRFSNQFQQVRTFPNPTTDIIAFDFQVNNTSALVEVYDLQGKKVMGQTILPFEQISLQHLQKGIYHYRIRENSMIIGNGSFVVGLK